jgi:hypothetical protein
MWVNAMSVLPCLVLVFDFLQASSLGDVSEDILDLSRGDMTFAIAWKQPALGVPCELFSHGIGYLWQQNYSARLLALRFRCLDMQIALLEVDVLCLDLGHLTHTKTGTSQQEQDASLSSVFGSLQQSFELCRGQEFLGLHAHSITLFLLQNF